MRWHLVIPALVSMLKADSTLVSLLGGAHIYRNKTRNSIQIPAVYYTLISEGVEENTAPFKVQWDVWANSLSEAASIEGRLYDLMHGDTIGVLAGFSMLAQYSGSTDDDSDEQGIVHRIVEYSYSPARS